MYPPLIYLWFQFSVNASLSEDNDRSLQQTIFDVRPKVYSLAMAKLKCICVPCAMLSRLT